MANFNARFSLFPAKEKTKETSPDYTGNLELTLSEVGELINWLKEQPGEQDYKGETVVKIRLAGWRAESKGGLQYLSGKMSPPLPPREAAATADALPF